jgi:hypothetical protein
MSRVRSHVKSTVIGFASFHYVVACAYISADAHVPSCPRDQQGQAKQNSGPECGSPLVNVPLIVTQSLITRM